MTETTNNYQCDRDIIHDLFHQAVFWHGVAMLPRLRELSGTQRQKIMKEANEHSLHEPLHLAGDEARFEIPTWGDDLLTAAQVMALIVFGLWVQIGEDERLASGLLINWPEVTVASQLVDAGVNQPAETVYA